MIARFSFLVVLPFMRNKVLKCHQVPCEFYHNSIRFASLTSLVSSITNLIMCVTSKEEMMVRLKNVLPLTEQQTKLSIFLFLRKFEYSNSN